MSNCINECEGPGRFLHILDHYDVPVCVEYPMIVKNQGLFYYYATIFNFLLLIKSTHSRLNFRIHFRVTLMLK